MTFPIWISTTETVTKATGTDFTANFPASGIQSGDLLVLILSRSATRTQTFLQTSGKTFTTVLDAWGSYGASISSGTLSIFKRVADGIENGGTMNWNSSFDNAGYCVAFATLMVFRGVDGTTPLIVDTTTATGSSSTTPDPPNLNATTAKDYLWCVYATGSTNSSVSAYPTNYSTGHSSNGNSSPAFCCASAIRSLNASSENPGTFTFSASGNWGAKTFAIAPAAAATGFNRAVVIP